MTNIYNCKVAAVHHIYYGQILIHTRSYYLPETEPIWYLPAVPTVSVVFFATALKAHVKSKKALEVGQSLPPNFHFQNGPKLLITLL